MYPGNKRNTPTYKVIPNIKVEERKNDFDSFFSNEITLCNNIDLNETYSYYK